MLEALSDFDLVKKTNDGHHDAFSILVARYQKPLHSLSMRYVRNSHLAEDIVQESFMKAFEKLSSFQFRSAFKSWIYRIVINTAKNSLRSKKPTVEIDNVQIQVENLCEINLIEKQLVEQAQILIKGLPEKQQKALELRVFDDLSFKEISEQTGVSINTALGRMRYALMNLRKLIDKNQIVLTN